MSAKPKVLSEEEKKASIVEKLFIIYNKAADDCIKHGCVLKMQKTGYEQVRPQYTVMNDSLEQLLKLLPGYVPEKTVGRPAGAKNKPVKKVIKQRFHVDDEPKEE